MIYFELLKKYYKKVDDFYAILAEWKLKWIVSFFRAAVRLMYIHQ